MSIIDPEEQEAFNYAHDILRYKSGSYEVCAFIYGWRMRKKQEAIKQSIVEQNIDIKLNENV